MAAKFTIDGQSLDDLAGRFQQLRALLDVLEEQPEIGLNSSLMCSIGRDLADLAQSQIANMRGAPVSEVCGHG